MGHKDYKDVEDFLIDDTFQQYCSQENAQCTQYWKRYISEHPEQQDTILRAQRLFQILSGNKKPVNQQKEQLRSMLNTPNTSKSWNRFSTYLQLAAGLAIVGFAYLWYTNRQDNQLPEAIEMAAIEQVYHTQKGEKKTFTLLDGTIVTLNSDSKLQIDAGFGKSNRQVFLEGEAYLDVKKDADKPFVLHTNEFDIRVLGTSFNVKSYPDELSSEALLIEGVIELKSKGKNENSIIVKPNQKVTIYKNELPLASKKAINTLPNAKPDLKEIAIQDVINNTGDEVLDIVWKENKLAISDQDFNELKGVLERWYDVNIILIGDHIGDFRFTGTFREENIDQVLKALQKIKPFNYEIYDKKVTIYEK